MEPSAFEHTKPQKKREERLREAKMLFRDEHLPHDNIPETFTERERTISFYRPLFSVLLFVCLITAFQFHYSFHGIDRNKVEKILSDDSHYQMLVKQAEMVIKQFAFKKP